MADLFESSDSDSGSSLEANTSTFGHADAIIEAVYRAVWHEFYSWETEHCQKIIDLLSLAEYPPPPDSGLVGEMEALELDSYQPENMIVDEVENPSSFSVWDVRKGCLQTRVFSDNIWTDRFEPHETYEFCTPASKNITPRDYERDDCSFIAYATSERWLSEATDLDSFAWQNDFIDPDIEMMQLETVRRLHFSHHFSLDKIDQYAGGKITRTRITNESGLFWATSQRDPLIWSESQLSQLDRLWNTVHCSANDVPSRVNRALSNFCPNLNCIQSYCPTHPELYPNFDTVKPKVTSTSMVLSQSDPCGDFCFRHWGETQTITETVYWDTADIEMLTNILKIVPDLSPCELSILCLKRCREVFAHRCKILPDNCIQRPIEDRVAPKISGHPKLRFVDNNENKFSPLTPCNHKGLCNNQSGCKCSISKVHCERNCRCTLDCQIRWKGCKCKKSLKGKRCTDDCRCLKVRRECEPEVCTSCNARSGSKCQNVKIQQGTTSVIEVKRGLAGLGGFATCNYAQGDLVGEYVAISYPNESPRPQPSYNLGYNFVLNESMKLDAARVGNPTRFFNHKERQNCQAKVLLVNGDHRIGIFAARKITSGEELFLDYGPLYQIH